jgi:hypothetical protein
MPKAESIISLIERLRQHSRKVNGHDFLVDLRLCRLFLRAFAANLITSEAAGEQDPAQRCRLEREADALARNGR